MKSEKKLNLTSLGMVLFDRSYSFLYFMGRLKMRDRKNAGRSKMQRWKMRDWKMWDQYAGVEIAEQSSMESLFANKSVKSNVRMQKWHWFFII